MISTCKYCNGLIPAITESNYCSNRGDHIDHFESNAFYFSNNHLESGSHISRFTLRAINGGFQYYNIDGSNKTLSDDNFLMVEKGSKFEHYLNQNTAVEGVIVAYSQKFLTNYFHDFSNSDKELLDNPIPYSSDYFHFYSNTFNKSDVLRTMLFRIAQDIRSKGYNKLYYQEFFSDIFDEVLRIDSHLRKRINNLNALKGKTRQELYRRLSVSKDYIDSNISKDLSLETISQTACLSPFHYLRSFKSFYNITPYQYILQQRLQRAKFHFDQHDYGQHQVMNYCGFDNIKTFQRAFKKYFGVTPSQYIIKQVG